MATYKKLWHIMLPLAILAALLSAAAGSGHSGSSPAQAAPLLQIGDTETPTPTATNLPTETQTPTATVTATQTPPSGSFERPIVVIKSYSTDPGRVNPGQDFDLRIQLSNAGENAAHNVVVSFTPGDFLPRSTGGVIAIQEITAGSDRSFSQPMTAAWNLWGLAISTLDATINYNDSGGNTYTEKFTLSINLSIPKSAAPTVTPTPTATPTSIALQRAQLVITNYETDIVPLQPGTNFNLSLQVENLGNITAKRITMIVGGGSTISNGTPGPGGGVSGAGGEFTNFAPLGASNIQTLGDLNAGGMVMASQPLIVNVTTSPGAYPMKISFAYTDDDGTPVIDEQVITLLVYTLPNVEISFYRDPGPMFTFQPNMLPIQINNLGRRSTVFGNLRVSAPTGSMENNTILVGNLEAGGYYTLDATYIPDMPGPVELTVVVDYTDDFNQPRQITRTLSVEVIEMPPPEDNFPPEGGEGGFPPPMTEETFWQKLWRVILGLLGLDSGKQVTPTEGFPTEGFSSEGMSVEEEAIPVGPPIKGP